MFRSRAVQYLGLAALVLACLGLIFYPIGPKPQPQDYTVHLSAPKSFAALALANKANATKTPTDIADAALNAAFTGGEKIPPGTLSIAPDGKSATILDRAATQQEAQSRSTRIAGALGKPFPGVKLAPQSPETQAQLASLPVTPLFELGQNAVYPRQDGTAIKRGLDLQGGVNLVLQVRRALFTYNFSQKLPNDPDARDAFATKARTVLAQNTQLGLDEANVNLAPGQSSVLEVRTQAADRASFDAQRAAITQALAGVAGAGFKEAREPQFFVPQDEDGKKLGLDNGDYQNQLLDRTVEIVRSRVDKLGVSEPQIQKQPPDRIIVQLPGIKDPQKAINVIGTTAQMEIRLLPEDLTPAQDPGNPGNTLFRDRTGNIVPSNAARERSQLIVAGTDVKPTTSAGYVGEGGEIGVFFELQGKGATQFANVTRQVAGKNRHIPIFLDERCISAPVVQSAITGGSGQISGGFETLEEARDLALLLNSGALPAPIDVVENRTISATLGEDSLRKSVGAGLIGLALVAAFMIVFYRLPGLLANVALVIYCLLNLAVFILIGGTLTLPGIAGFLLAIAMSLDTNILVFERLKEEMAIQPTFSAALRAAFSRAWTAILDSHVTTLIAAVVLFIFGTGPVKGFALTLGIGVLLSLFSAISVTRLFMWSIVKTGETRRGLFGGLASAPAHTVTSKTAGAR